MTRGSIRIVIDASITQAAGGPGAGNPVSKAARDFLYDVLQICHRAVVTPEIGREWKRHRSNYARQWYRSMVARRKVCFLESQEGTSLRGKVVSLVEGDKARHALGKDAHLVDAALATDGCIASLDNTARAFLGSITPRVRELQKMQWVNPAEAAYSRSWLAAGARPSPSTRLA